MKCKSIGTLSVKGIYPGRVRRLSYSDESLLELSTITDGECARVYEGEVDYTGLGFFYDSMLSCELKRRAVHPFIRTLEVKSTIPPTHFRVW